MSRLANGSLRALTGSLTDDRLETRSLSDLSISPPYHLNHDAAEEASNVPLLAHRLRHTSSIMVVAASDTEIFAGTQAGEIVIYGLDTYERKAVVEAHKGSVLGLCLSPDRQLLFSSAGDRIVNVWNTQSLARVASLYSPFDIGDVFCVAYSSALRTAYMGAQNTTISWCSLSGEVTRAVHPSLRDHTFFDSAGPGGVRTPRPAEADVLARHAFGGRALEISREHVKHFAHYGYVNCMILVKDGVPEAAGQEILITGGGDGVIKLWKLHSTGIEEIYKLDDEREEGHAVQSIAIDGTFLFSARSGGEIDVWDLETRQMVRNIKAHSEDVLSISLGGGLLFSAAITGNVRKFDRQYALTAKWQAHHGRILTSTFTYYDDRPIYVTGGSDSTLAIWDVSPCIQVSTATTKTNNEQMLDYLRKFVAYRTVSSNAVYQPDCRRGASYLRSVFKNFGASTEMLTTPGNHNPIILARFRGNPTTNVHRKKILFYGHYDVVDAANDWSKWTTGDPFAMQGVDGYLYGRGVSDNKGPIMAAIFACAELMSEQALGSDIVFLIEGEEESGSRGFEQAVRAAKDKIGPIDWILLANSYWLDDRVPCLTYGLRGVIHATVEVESEYPDLHSGVDGSRQLDESLKDLVMLLSTLTGKNGEVRIPGFYDPIPPITEAEQALYTDITRALVQRNPSLGSQVELAQSLMRRWRDPSLTIHRFQTSGPDNATIIPRLAKAALSLRLVPNQEASAVAASLKVYLQAEFDKLESNNTLTVKIEHQAEPWLGDWTNDIFKTLEDSIIEVWSTASSDQTIREQRKATLGQHKQLDNQSRDCSYFSRKLSPTTSTTLASQSIGTPNPIESISIVDDKLSRLADSTEPRTKPLYIREGGSIPAIRFLEKEFDAPAAHFPVGQASDSAHLNNERLRLLNLYIGRDVMKKVFAELPKK